MLNYSGRWFSTFGPLTLTQDGDQVHGNYVYRGREGAIEGRIDKGRLVFTYHEPDHDGEGWFELRRDGKFLGAWRMDGSQRWGTWEGTRGFEGVWETSYGRMRLIQEEDRVLGFYEGGGQSTLEGGVEGDRFVFRYKEPRAGGEGWFALDEEGQSFSGEWHADGMESWSTWLGKRVEPKPNLTWLVVLEAHWQRGLSDREYSFGGMLKEYFARLENVAVRHRFFDDEAGLKRWCQDLLYTPEPALVFLASHGTPDGLCVQGQHIDCSEVVQLLRYADCVRLLHFSACLTMAGGQDGPFVKMLQEHLPFPVSGYTTSVDWGASALLEFLYLDLMLAKGLTPERAAEQVLRQLGYAGEEAPEGSPYPALDFRFLAPPTETPTPGQSSEMHYC